MTQHEGNRATITLASQGRRLGGFALDTVLSIVTLGIGWIIWYLIVARRGQSPAKQLLGMRVIREDGSAAGLGWMLLRDLVVRGIAFGALNLVLTAIAGTAGGAIAGLVFVVAALWCVWDANRQCLWDKVVRTRVVHGPGGGGAAVAAGDSGAGEREAAENLRTLAELRDRGLLTTEEYEERRAREIERL